ncbi:MAG: hypothetical protein AAB316_23935 [Bacteroidota bacterium]
MELELEPVSKLKRTAKKQAGAGLGYPSISAFLTYDQVVELDEFGEPRLKTWRLEQLTKGLKEFGKAQQYALVAEKAKMYPCLKCPQSAIFLNLGDVWKYGATKKGEIGRYGRTFLVENELEYFAQFYGNWEGCLMEEKKKIFNYPLLPENQSRPLQDRLSMPPGNLRTD